MTGRRIARARAGRWRCLLCDARGIGGLELWRRHYAAAHYVEPQP